jgi:phage tail-like protein
MAVRAERPYVQFNFQVDLARPGWDQTTYAGGFQEVSGIGMEVTVTEYRNGNDKDNGVRKITGLNKAADVTLKRGVIGARTLFEWLDEIRNGDQQAFKDVTVTMLSESREAVLEWRLLRARITKCTYGPLNAKGNDVAMEEMVLAYERLEMKEV